VTLAREIIHLETVMGARRNADDTWNFFLDDSSKIGYIRVTSFSRETAGQVRSALEQLQTGSVKGLILDLRFDPGGLLTSAIDICDMFISQGRIVSTAGRNSPERVWDAHGPGTFEGFAMAILVNRYSASASEIVSACLQDHNRAVIIGERTWGKGSVQNVIELEGGRSALKLTTAGYLRPSGKNIHRTEGSSDGDEWGVVPNDGFALQLSDEEMAGLLEHRRRTDMTNGLLAPAAAADLPQREDLAPPSVVAAPVAGFADRQLQKALEYLAAEVAKEPAEAAAAGN
jgi:carboxyl-terminal processing protease